MSVVLIINALVCAQCQVVFDGSGAGDDRPACEGPRADRFDCPMCASNLAVWPLARWLNREGLAVSAGGTNRDHILDLIDALDQVSAVRATKSTDDLPIDPEFTGNLSTDEYLKHGWSG